jgi:5,10-methylenetetrahydromethanopterin reductase
VRAQQAKVGEMSMVEFWRSGGAGGSIDPSQARIVEADGWDGQMFMDSQSLGADPYVIMGAWAMLTERMKLSPGVTNPLTRHLAVTAASIAALQEISKGRAVLGIGRGDSALAYLGKAPVKIGAFERALEQLQVLLRGEKIAFGADTLGSAAPSLDTLALGARPTEFGLNWLKPDVPKTPIDVAATGPKVIEMAARIAEQVTVSVGAIPERMRWALGLAEEARAAHGLPKGGVSYGAQIIVICHRDLQTALEFASGAVPNLARFQVIQGAPAGPLAPGDAETFQAIRSGYDMTKHDKLTAAKLIGATLDPAFISRFAIVGPPDACIPRLVELARCGLDRFVIVGPAFYPDGADGKLFSGEVMPAVRRELAG